MASTRSRWRSCRTAWCSWASSAVPNLERADGRTGSIFVAERGGGAWELALDGDATATRVHVADISDPSRARYAESLEAAHSAQDEALLIAERLGITEPPLRLDSQAKYGLVARGDASVYLRIPRDGYVENIWDHAAGAIVVTEAGGTVTDVDGAALDWTMGRRLTRNRGIIAAPAAIHDAVVAAARAVLRPPRTSPVRRRARGLARLLRRPPSAAGQAGRPQPSRAGCGAPTRRCGDGTPGRWPPPWRGRSSSVPRRRSWWR